MSIKWQYKKIDWSYCLAITLAFLCTIPILAQNDLDQKLEEAQIHIYTNPEKAIEICLAIYPKVTELDTRVSTLITMINGYTALNNNEVAMEYAMEALELAKESESIHFQIRTLGLLAEQYQLYHLNSISREYLDKAEKLLTDPSLDEEDVVIAKGNIYAVKGNSYKDQIDCKYAIDNYNKAIATYQTLTNRTKAENNLALVYLEKAGCLVDIEELTLAEENYNSAREIAEKNGLLEYVQYAELGLAKIETVRNQSEKAIARLAKLSQASFYSNELSIEVQVYNLLKNNYRNLNDMALYLENYQKYSLIFDVVEKKDAAAFEQILSFIQQPKSNPTSSSRKIVLYTLITLVLLVFLYEIYTVIYRSRH